MFRRSSGRVRGSMEECIAKAYHSSDAFEDDDPGLFHLLGTSHLGEDIEFIFRDGKSHTATINEKEDTFLHVAAQTKNLALAKLMIEEDADVNAQNKLGQSPLILAIEKDANEVVELLVEAGANVNLRDNCNNWPPAMIGQRHWATRKVLKYFLEKLESDCSSGKDEIAKKLIELNWSLLHVVKLRDADLTKLVLQHGPARDINEIDHDYSGRTALHVAVKLADIENVKLLLENEADVNAKDFENLTPLWYAYDDTNQYLDERLNIVKVLIERGATLNSSDPEYDPAVFKIFEYGSREVIRLVLQSAVELSVASEAFKCGIVYALAANENPEGAIEELRGKNLGVDLDKPMIIAARYCNARGVEFLLDEGADIDNVDSESISAIHCVFRCSSKIGQRKYRECVQVLLERGADLELKIDDRGNSTILDIVFSEKQFLLGQLVLCHLALQEILGNSISQIIRSRIESHILFKSYFESSKRQLSMEMCQSISLFDLLTASDKKLELYVMGNEELVSKVPDFVDALSGYYYFRTLLQKRLAKIVLKHKTAQVICKIIGKSYESFPIIIDKILSYLEPQDMKNLMDASI